MAVERFRGSIMRKLSITLVQMSSGLDMERNLTRIHELLVEAPPSDLLAFPEVFVMRGGHDDYVASARPVPGEMTEILAGVAVERHSWLLAGSLMEEDGSDVYNTSVLFDRSGSIVGSYRKMHLFEAHLDAGRTIREADTYSSGSVPVLADMEGWRCGMSICYDLRFPELYRRYSAEGAGMLFVPSDFTQRTGRDHWEALLRARAIENQCYVVAPAQCGANPATGIESYGHSMVVGPWGEVLCHAGDKEVVLSAEIDSLEIKEVRARIPVLDHRRLS